MINNISWSMYWIIMGGILFFYYATIGLNYYFSEIWNILSGRVPVSAVIKRKSMPEELGSEKKILPDIDQFKQDILMILKDAAAKKLLKNEILFTLQLLFREYPIITDASFKTLISDYILNECKMYCSIHLDEEDIVSLWVR